MGNELQNRIAAAWSKFHSLKRLLLNSGASVAKRLKLFDATVGGTMLWCSESWFLTASQRLAVRRAQQAMLRKIVAPNRMPEEDWVAWVKRSTRKARDVANRVGIRWWTAAHARAKWIWAGHAAGSGMQTWVRKVLTWRDSVWQSVVDRTSHRYVKRSRTGP